MTSLQKPELPDGHLASGIPAPIVRRWLVRGFALGFALGAVTLVGFLLSG